MLDDLLEECLDDLLADVSDGVALVAASSAGSSTEPAPAAMVAAAFGDDTTLLDEVDEVDDAVDSFRRSL